MAWTNPRTWVAGEKPTAATLNAHIRDNLSALNAKTQFGSATSASVANGAGADISVTFPVAFAATPTVVACNGTNRNDPQLMAITVKSVTTTGFTARVHNTTGGSITISINWIASVTL